MPNTNTSILSLKNHNPNREEPDLFEAALEERETIEEKSSFEGLGMLSRA